MALANKQKLLRNLELRISGPEGHQAQAVHSYGNITQNIQSKGSTHKDYGGIRTTFEAYWPNNPSECDKLTTWIATGRVLKFGDRHFRANFR
jgi:hypothetical protein